MIAIAATALAAFVVYTMRDRIGGRRQTYSKVAPVPLQKDSRTKDSLDKGTRPLLDAQKAPGKKAPAKKAPGKKAPAKKAPANKVPANKVPANKAPAKTGRDSPSENLLLVIDDSVSSVASSSQLPGYIHTVEI